MFTRTRIASRPAAFARPALTAAALLAAAGGALADGTVCDPRLPYTMPDLDQRRDPGPGVFGLPGGGSMYCVPACNMNIIKYLTNHGYPQLSPSAGPWLGNAAVYNQMTLAIQGLGNAMGTSATDGTNGTDGTAGVNQWINNAGLQGDIVLTTDGLGGASSPELGDLALAMLLDCPTSISVGWYSENPTGVLTRTGGHCVSVTRLPNFCSPTRQLSIRDPGSDNNNDFNQGVGTTETYNIQTRNVVVMKDGAPVYNGPIERIVGYGSGHIDGYRIYNPAFGIAACNNPINGSCIATHMPETVLTNQPQTTHFDLPGQAVLSLDLLPSNLRFVAIVAGETPSAPNQILVADRAGGDPVPVPVPFSPTCIATGDAEGRIYALDGSGSTLHHIDWRQGRSGIGGTTLPAPAAALCFDDRNDQIVLLSAQERRIMRVDTDTGDVVMNVPLPDSVQLGASPQISICPVGSYIWLTSGTPSATGLMTDASGGLAVAANIRLNVPNPPSFSGVDNDDRGHVFTFADGELIEFAPPAAPGEPWTQVPESRFARLADGGLFKIARSRSSLKPEIHDSPEWALNVLPTEFAPSVPDCIADWDNNGSVDSRDISAFLTSWLESVGTQDLAADFNADGTTNSIDISAFLAAWLQNIQSGNC